MADGELLDDLREQIAGGTALVVVGTGVAASATHGAPTATWRGLLEDGIARVEQLSLGALPADWAELTRRQLAAGDLNWLLGVAEEITVRLGGAEGGEFRRWLRDAVGELRARDRSVVDALLKLGAPIATTNYDGLIEEVSGLPYVTWRDGARMQRVLREDGRAILHLHGHWDEPRSVVLGIRSYDEILRDGAAQALQQVAMSLRSLVFVGFGAGLSDPNFAALRAWFAARFADLEYRHFRLCLADEREAIAQEHGLHERIVPIVYGTSHDQLAEFLSRLSGELTIDEAPVTEPAPTARHLPPAPMCVGRDTQLEDLAEDLVGGTGAIVVLGPPGIGKSTVCLAAVHDQRVMERFGQRRWFVRCDGATNTATLLAAIAEELGVTGAASPPALLDGVLAALGTGRALLVLDNLETPWTHDPLETERLLATFAAVPELTLLGAVRGAQRPGGVRWIRTVTVVPLDAAAARLVFLATAGEAYADDPQLDELLEELDGLPLAVELLAHAAQGEPHLDGLMRRWQTERVALLERLGGGDPRLSVSASVEVSWNSPLMEPDGRELLALLGQLPDGVAQSDLEALLGDRALAAAANARKLGLAFTAGDRLRTLAPIREHLARQHPPGEALERRLLDHYLALADTEGSRIGWPGGAAAVRRLAAETGNLNRVFERQDIADVDASDDALIALLRYSERTGNDIPAVMASAQRRLERAADDDTRVVGVRKALGDLALLRSELVTAREHFEHALKLYEASGSVLGRANCLHRLGDVALYERDVEAAREAYERAHPLYEEVGDVLGQANCVRRLGSIAYSVSDFEGAREHLERAQPLYLKAGDALGTGGCIKELGDVAFRLSEFDAATELYERALPIVEELGDVLSSAQCLFQLGAIAGLRSDVETARALTRRALDGYVQARLPILIAMSHARLAELASADAEREEHVVAARAIWSEIGREDLIEAYFAEGQEA